MKRYKWLLPILLLITLCFGGCSAAAGGVSGDDPTEFLKGPILLEGILQVGEKEYGVRMESQTPPNGKVSFTAPESMKGYVFEKAEDGFYVSYGDLRVPLRQSTLPGGVGKLLGLLNFEGVNFEKSEEKANGMELFVYTFSGDGEGKVKLYLKKSDSTPLRIEFASDELDAVFHIQKAEY